jgi:hypothetical protein
LTDPLRSTPNLSFPAGEGVVVSKGSLLLVILFHTATNAPLTLVLLPLGIENWVLPFWLMAGFTVVAAVVVVAVFGPSRLSRLPKQTQPTTPAEATEGASWPSTRSA